MEKPKCVICGYEFHELTSQEEMSEELMNNFGPVIATMDDIYLTCDDCYKIIMQMITEEDKEELRQELLSRIKN